MTNQKYAIFSIPTKEARIFANMKPEQVSELYSENDNSLQELCEDFNRTGYYDENISHYAIRTVKQ